MTAYWQDLRDFVTWVARRIASARDPLDGTADRAMPRTIHFYTNRAQRNG